MIVGVAMGGAGRPAPPPEAEETHSAAVVAGVPEWFGGAGIIPVKAQVKAAPHDDRGVRARVPLVSAALAAAALAVLGARRGRVRRSDVPRPPLALRAWSRPRRAPPLSLLAP